MSGILNWFSVIGPLMAWVHIPRLFNIVLSNNKVRTLDKVTMRVWCDVVYTARYDTLLVLDF